MATSEQSFKVLSICIPTRNRQEYASELLKEYKNTIEQGVEIVIGDNSDDTEFLPKFALDLFDGKLPEWLVFLESPSRTLSMRENWERVLNASTGDWVTFIGDDDYADPLIADLLRRLCRNDDEFEFLGWTTPRWPWPDARTHNVTVDVDLRSGLKSFPLGAAFKTIIECESARPSSMCTVYHGAVRRRLVEKVRGLIDGGDGVFFKHSNTDYISGWLAAVVCKKSAFSERPLSIVGGGRKSNSFHLREKDGLKISMERFTSEIEGDDYIAASTFDTIKVKRYGSITEYFYFLQIDFMRVVKEIKGFAGDWKKNLTLRANVELAEITDIDQYETVKDSVNKFLTDLGCEPTKAEYQPPIPERSLAKGLTKGGVKLLVSPSAWDKKTASGFYYAITEIVNPIFRIGELIKQQKRGDIEGFK